MRTIRTHPGQKVRQGGVKGTVPFLDPALQLHPVNRLAPKRAAEGGAAGNQAEPGLGSRPRRSANAGNGAGVELVFGPVAIDRGARRTGAPSPRPAPGRTRTTRLDATSLETRPAAVEPGPTVTLRIVPL